MACRKKASSPARCDRYRSRKRLWALYISPGSRYLRRTRQRKDRDYTPLIIPDRLVPMFGSKLEPKGRLACPR
jgi:hypothetical protein